MGQGNRHTLPLSWDRSPGFSPRRWAGHQAISAHSTLRSLHYRLTFTTTTACHSWGAHTPQHAVWWLQRNSASTTLRCAVLCCENQPQHPLDVTSTRCCPLCAITAVLHGHIPQHRCTPQQGRQQKLTQASANKLATQLGLGLSHNSNIHRAVYHDVCALNKHAVNCTVLCSLGSCLGCTK